MCLILAGVGCSFGPKALQSTHGRYNQAVLQVNDEQQLLNLVRLRYGDNVARLDVASIAAQYELETRAEAQPFFSAQAARNDGFPVYDTFTSILPFAGVSSTNRPTISLNPLDDPESIRPLFVPNTLDGIIFLSETSWPVSTVFRLYVETMNRLPNAVTASGPERGVVPEYQPFLRVMRLLQQLQDAGDLRFLREEKITETGSPLPESAVTATALVEAAKAGYEYRQNADRTWVLIKRGRHLVLRIRPDAVGSPEVTELCDLLNLQPGLAEYDVTVGGPSRSLAHERLTHVNLYPRSTAQALFYMSRGVMVPSEHYGCGLVKPTVGPDGEMFDWQQVLGGLFTVHAVKQHKRPKCAYVAVKYRDYWYYIDDRDSDSKVTFTLMTIMTRLDLLGARKGGPALTLPVGR
jgi:hypothetical protein